MGLTRLGYFLLIMVGITTVFHQTQGLRIPLGGAFKRRLMKFQGRGDREVPMVQRRGGLVALKLWRVKPGVEKRGSWIK